VFEVNVFTPAQFGAFVAWLVINRGPLSVLVHPNTGFAEVSEVCFILYMGGSRGGGGEETRTETETEADWEVERS